MGYFKFCVKRLGKTKKNKLKGDTNIILGGQKYNFGRKKIIFLVYLRLFLKNLGGRIQHVGPPLIASILNLKSKTRTQETISKHYNFPMSKR
jgi:hypothetical protein